MGLMVDRICAIGRSSGQMTVEFVAALPVLLAVAVISVNALTYFGWCAAFDDDFRDSVRVYAASPAYGQVMGVALPKLSHIEELVVDCYKPGVLL